MAVLTGGTPAPAGRVRPTTAGPFRDIGALVPGIALRRVTSTGFDAAAAASAVFGDDHAGYDTGGEGFSLVASDDTDDTRALAVTCDHENVRLSVSR